MFNDNNSEGTLHEKLLTWAYSKDSKQMVYVDDVPNGYKCGCVCPNCGKPLNARNRHQSINHPKLSHFAHKKGDECEGAYETMLHILAKEVFVNTGKIMCPQNSNKSFPNGLLELHDIKSEEYDKQFDIKPDCEGLNHKGERFLIEFYVTHQVSPEKRQKIINNNLNCIEIDLNHIVCSEQRKLPDEIKNFIENNSKHREWIEEEKEPELIEEVEHVPSIHLAPVSQERRWKQIYNPPAITVKTIIQSENKEKATYSPAPEKTGHYTDNWATQFWKNKPPTFLDIYDKSLFQGSNDPRWGLLRICPTTVEPVENLIGEDLHQANVKHEVCEGCSFLCGELSDYVKNRICEWYREGVVPPRWRKSKTVVIPEVSEPTLFD